jgi:hypothetical protein
LSIYLFSRCIGETVAERLEKKDANQQKQNAGQNKRKQKNEARKECQHKILSIECVPPPPVSAPALPPPNAGAPAILPQKLNEALNKVKKPKRAHSSNAFSISRQPPPPSSGCAMEVT